MTDEMTVAAAAATVAMTAVVTTVTDVTTEAVTTVTVVMTGEAMTVIGVAVTMVAETTDGMTAAAEGMVDEMIVDMKGVALGCPQEGREGVGRSIFQVALKIKGMIINITTFYSYLKKTTFMIIILVKSSSFPDNL